MRQLTEAEILECAQLGITVSSTHFYTEEQIALIMSINVETAADPVYMIYLQACEIPEYGFNYATFLDDLTTNVYTIEDVSQDIEDYNNDVAFTPAPITAGVVDPPALPSPLSPPVVAGVDIVKKGFSMTIVVVLAAVAAFIIFVSSIGGEK